MSRTSLAVLLLSATALVPNSGWAQSGPSSPDPLNAGVPVPLVTYDSSFARYRAFAEQEVAPWRESNDNAGRIGGWRAYAKEARESGPGGSGAPAAAVKPVAAETAKSMPQSHGSQPMMNHGGRRE